MAEVVLALDIAGRTGWAHTGATAGVPKIGSWDGPTPDKAEDGSYVYGACFASFNRFVRWKLAEIKPTIFVFEAPIPTVGPGTKASQFQTTSHTIRYLSGLIAHAECAAFDAGVDSYEKSPQAIKHYFVGDRGAKKEQMMARCRQLRWPIKNDDEADAAALWAMASSIVDPKFSLASGPLFAGAAR